MAVTGIPEVGMVFCAAAGPSLRMHKFQMFISRLSQGLATCLNHQNAQRLLENLPPGYPKISRNEHFHWLTVKGLYSGGVRNNQSQLA